MDEQSLYEKQYGENKLISINSFPFLRRIFNKYDLHREDLTLRLLGDVKGKLLDIGCGSGSLVFKSKTMAKYEEIYGIDISPSRIKEAKKQAIEKFGDVKNIHFSCCNVNARVDFPDGMFDAVTCIAVIEHIFDPYYVISEIHRVLKKGGIFIVEVPNIAYIKQRLKLLFGQLPVTSPPFNWKEIGWDGGHLHYFTQKSLCGLLKESGFKVLKVSGCGLFAKIRNIYPSLLTGDLVVKAKKC